MKTSNNNRNILEKSLELAGRPQLETPSQHTGREGVELQTACSGASKETMDEPIYHWKEERAETKGRSRKR